MLLTSLKACSTCRSASDPRSSALIKAPSSNNSKFPTLPRAYLSSIPTMLVWPALWETVPLSMDCWMMAPRILVTQPETCSINILQALCLRSPVPTLRFRRPPPQPRRRQLSSPLAAPLWTRRKWALSVDGRNAEPVSAINDLGDLDVEMSDITDKGGESDWVMVQGDVGQEQSGNNRQPSTTAAAPAASAAPGATGTTDPAAMFDTADFGNFEGLDADFASTGDVLGLDLDTSAFNDAFRGSESHHGGTEGGNEA